MTPERYQRIRTVLDRRQPDLTVLLDNVHKPHNFSAITRSCDAVGVMEVHGVWPVRKLRPTNHTSGGSRKWVGVRTHPTLQEAIDFLKGRGTQIYAAHLSGSAEDYRAVDYTVPCALVLGAELTGLSREGIDLADQHVAIPIMGMVHSLNVSVAAALILFEAQRQRHQAGLYDQVRLDAETYHRTLVEWLHPDVAEYCRKHQHAYPDLDESGEILDFDINALKDEDR